MPRKRQIGTRIDDSGEIAEAWDEFKEDYENKSSAMRQLMRQGLEIDESETGAPESKSADATTTAPIQSMYVGTFVTLVGWLITTASSVIGVLNVPTGSLVVSGLIVLGILSTVLHIRWVSEQPA
ncbi:hypothetical protein ACFQJ7_15750 [Halovenus rubra]|uniref:Uncharacterized protein n=2 Tax=Halovenus rubra TaxID=869890 RepID=A0ABD5XBX3_9EURY|nr:hypothetical protein [Halovenus rubra]